MIQRGVTLLGDIKRASEFINYAHGQLASWLNRVDRRSVVVLRPANDIEIRIVTHPHHSIKITAIGGVFVTFADPTSEVIEESNQLEAPFQSFRSRYIFEKYDKYRRLPFFYSGGTGWAYYPNATVPPVSYIAPTIASAVDSSTLFADNTGLINGRVASAMSYWHNGSRAISWSGSTLFVRGRYGQITLNQQSDEQIVACCLVSNEIGLDLTGGGNVIYTAAVVTTQVSTYAVSIEGTRAYRNVVKLKFAVFDDIVDGLYNINSYSERTILDYPTAHPQSTPTINVTGFTQNGKQIAYWYKKENNPTPNGVYINIVTFSADYATETDANIYTDEYPYLDTATDSINIRSLDVRAEGNIFACMYVNYNTVLEGYVTIGSSTSPITSEAISLNTMSLWSFDSLDEKDAVDMLGIGLINPTVSGHKSLENDLYTSPRGWFVQMSIGYYSIRYSTYFFTVHRIAYPYSGLPPFTTTIQDYSVIFRQDSIDTVVYTTSWANDYSPTIDFVMDLVGNIGKAPREDRLIMFRNTNEWNNARNICLSAGDYLINEYPTANYNLAETDNTLVICGEFSSTDGTVLSSYTIAVNLDLDPEKQTFTVSSGRMDEVVLAEPINASFPGITLNPPYGSGETYLPFTKPITKLYLPMSVTHI